MGEIQAVNMAMIHLALDARSGWILDPGFGCAQTAFFSSPNHTNVTCDAQSAPSL
jgi:hypothetical protein